jgi:hypothetical protein
MKKIVQGYFVAGVMVTAMMPAAYSQMSSMFKKTGPRQLPFITAEQKITSVQNRPSFYLSVPVLQPITWHSGSGDEGNFSKFVTTTNDVHFVTSCFSSNDADITGNHDNTDVRITKHDASGNLITIKYNNHEIKNYFSNSWIIAISGIGNPCATALFSKA